MLKFAAIIQTCFSDTPADNTHHSGRRWQCERRRQRHR